MKLLTCVFAISMLVGTCCSAHVSLERKQDSYVDALQDSNNQGKHTDIHGFTDNFAAAYDINPMMKPSYGPPPPPSYGPPAAPVYGPSASPSSSYGPPPKPVYGPPAGPPPNVHVYPIYQSAQHPRGDWLWDKFHLKFDLFTIGKILLKLIIFKKMVKFFAVICLLLFLPTLIEKKKEIGGSGEHETDEMFRGLKPLGETARFNELTTFVMASIDAFAAKRNADDKCTSGELSCRFKRMLDTVDNKYPFKRLAKWTRGETGMKQQLVAPKVMAAK